MFHDVSILQFCGWDAPNSVFWGVHLKDAVEKPLKSNGLTI